MATYRFWGNIMMRVYWGLLLLAVLAVQPWNLRPVHDSKPSAPSMIPVCLMPGEGLRSSLSPYLQADYGVVPSC